MICLSCTTFVDGQIGAACGACGRPLVIESVANREALSRFGSLRFTKTAGLMEGRIDATALDLASRPWTREARSARSRAQDDLPTLVITNPPMGRRVERGGAVALLERFAARLPTITARDGRVAWITPFPRRTDPILSAGFRLDYDIDVDLGGFNARLQRWTR